MDRKELIAQIKKKQSFLCVGLDTDIERIPKFLMGSDDPVFDFNKAIIDATKDFCVAYKPNIAFYESLGVAGWQSLKRTLDYIPKEIFTIADAKRGDIGNTSKMYAKAFFENMDFDSITVAPYMGKDSVSPFLEYKNKWVIVLAATSNIGAEDFQFVKLNEGQKLFEWVLEKSRKWGNEDNLMYVVGATRPEIFREVRKIVPHHFLLVPGVGAQGGGLEEVAEYGMNEEIGLLVNSSRQIIYASTEKDFAEKAAMEAKKIQQKMSILLREKNIL